MGGEWGTCGLAVEADVCEGPLCRASFQVDCLQQQNPVHLPAPRRQTHVVSCGGGGGLLRANIAASPLAVLAWSLSLACIGGRELLATALTLDRLRRSAHDTEADASRQRTQAHDAAADASQHTLTVQSYAGIAKTQEPIPSGLHPQQCGTTASSCKIKSV